MLWIYMIYLKGSEATTIHYFLPAAMQSSPFFPPTRCQTTASGGQEVRNSHLQRTLPTTGTIEVQHPLSCKCSTTRYAKEPVMKPKAGERLGGIIEVSIPAKDSRGKLSEGEALLVSITALITHYVQLN